MAKAQFSGVSLSFQERVILDGVTIALDEHTHAALAGENGSGKSTLLKAIAGLLAPDAIEKAVQKGIRIAYLAQSNALIDSQNRSINHPTDNAGGISPATPTASAMPTVMEAVTEAAAASAVAALADYEIELVVMGLGFKRADFARKITEFSGGWQMRIALAKVLLQRPDIMLLDEPTNYLDLESREFLSDFLQHFSGGFLIVSHDRAFLDATVSDVYELFNGKLKRYPGNYSHYETVRKTELASLVARYKKQQSEITKMEDFIRRFGSKATKAAQAQEYQKILAKMEKVEIPESLKTMHFTFPPPPHSGNIVMQIENLSKKYSADSLFVIQDLNLLIEKGEKIAVRGVNGAGKTTLLRILAKINEPTSGKIYYGAGVEAGCFFDDTNEVFDKNKTILELVEESCPLSLVPKVRDMLGAFLFRGDDVFKTLAVLSGGENTRMALLRLLLKPVNLLILDEPTNHLDLQSKDVLLEALQQFAGTVIFVSHDKDFIERLATRQIEITVNRTVDAREASGKTGAKIDTETLAKQTWENAKKQRNEQQRLKKLEETLLEEISQCEKEKAECEHSLADEKIYTDAEKSKAVIKRIAELEEKLPQLFLRWEETTAAISP
ncbi:MAG: ABC-F family ATP-binding cassette domain-containing protein [Treponemataceae bacterium]|nr:MAG: ABC-F family ATP-binding cassette domain-containing protein [Treponemataceae bacterium]